MGKEKIAPFELRNATLYLLDQRKLPFRKIYHKCSTYSDVARCIKSMVVRGAPLLGIVTAYGMLLGIEKYKYTSHKDLIEFVEHLKETFLGTRPTAVNIRWAAERIHKAVLSNINEKFSKIKEIVSNEVKNIVEEVYETDRLISINGLKIFEEGEKKTVLTHCNTGKLATGGIGTALGIIKYAFKNNRIRHVYVDETRPYLQGAKLTCWELYQEKIPFTLICDNTAGYLMKMKEIDIVIVGADRIALNGDVANKIGTYSLAVLAKENNIPFYVAAPISTIDFNISSGKEIPIEERSSDEVKIINNRPITLKSADVLHLGFDITPAKYITGIVTERGIFSYPYRKKILSLRKL